MEIIKGILADHPELNLKRWKIVYKPFYHNLLKLCQEHYRSKKRYNLKVYRGITEARHLRTYAATLIPDNSFYTLQQAEPLIHSAFCLENNISIDDDVISNITPSASTYRKIIREVSAKSIYDNIRDLKHNPVVWLMADKGTENKKGKRYALMPKLLCFYNPVSERVEEILLDVGAAGGTSLDAAIYVKYSIKRLLKLDKNLSLTIIGVVTDSGVGGTLSSFLRALAQVFHDSTRVTVSHTAEFVSCSLHNIQTCLRNGVLKSFGDSGTIINDQGQHVSFKKNDLQLIYQIANIHNYVDVFLLESMWNVCCDKIGVENKLKTMSKPYLTRWWTVGVSVS